MKSGRQELRAATLAAVMVLLMAAPARGQNYEPKAELGQADALIKQGKPDQALLLLQQLAAKDSTLPGLAARLGKIYYEKRDFERAAASLKRATEQDPKDGESVQLLGLTDYLMGHLPEAIPLLEKVQSWLPRPDPTGSYVLGLSYLQTRNFDKARAAFAKMFSVPVDSAGAHLALAKMMLGHEFEEEAVSELEKALALDPRLPQAHFMLGEIYLFKSDVPHSLEEFRRELEINPIAWYTYWRMGDAYTRLEKWDEAEQALMQSIWLNQDFSGPYILLGKVELKKGLADLAAGFLERAIKMDPNNFSAHYLLGSAYKQLGRAQDADREFQLSETLHQARP